jgi:hypothetical protein
MKREFFLKNLWLWKCGFSEMNYGKEDFMQLKKSEWSCYFEKLMKNRLLMGAFRYGKLNGIDKAEYDRIKSIEKRILLYRKTKNKEVLVDIANLCLLEFEEGDGIFNALYDSEHTQIKGR